MNMFHGYMQDDLGIYGIGHRYPEEWIVATSS